MTSKNELRLLSEYQWGICEKCHGRMPEFASMPDALRRELETLLETSPVQAMYRLKHAGCSYEVDKA